jgi:hypothetical protein
VLVVHQPFAGEDERQDLKPNDEKRAPQEGMAVQANGG